MRILNLTQHVATADQVAAGVVEPADKHLVQALITFENLPDTNELKAKAAALAQMVAYDRFDTAMIGGAPYFMAPLEASLQAAGIVPVYAFSKRVSVDEVQADGSIKKTQVFRHAGFVCACGTAAPTKTSSPSESARDSFSEHRWARACARCGVLIGGGNED